MPPIPFIDLPRQYQSIRAEVDVAIGAVLERQDFILGSEVEQLEAAVAALQGCRFGVACASGSDALLLTLQALGVNPGDRVLVPAFTFVATAASVSSLHATPVFTDIDPRTFAMSAESAATVLGGSPAKALVPVHLYGQCASMEALLSLARRHGLHVVEDAAQAILARSAGRPAGSMGAAGCFSFYPTKNLGGFGDGGMITTNDQALAERLRLLRNHGSQNKQDYLCVGVNSRLDTLQAAVLLVKLRHLSDWTALRQQKAAYYRSLFAGSGWADAAAVYPSQEIPVILPPVGSGAVHVYHQFTIRAWQRDALRAHLESRGTSTAVFYPVALHQQPAFSSLGHSPGDFPESERAAREVLSLPIYPELSPQEQVRVVEQIRSFYLR